MLFLLVYTYLNARYIVCTRITSSRKQIRLTGMGDTNIKLQYMLEQKTSQYHCYGLCTTRLAQPLFTHVGVLARTLLSLPIFVVVPQSVVLHFNCFINANHLIIFPHNIVVVFFSWQNRLLVINKQPLNVDLSLH